MVILGDNGDFGDFIKCKGLRKGVTIFIITFAFLTSIGIAEIGCLIFHNN